MMSYTATAPHSTLVRGVDRCDRCGAEAYVRVMVLSSRLPLLFCSHHYVEKADALRPVAVVTHDERALIDSGWAVVGGAA